MKPLSGYAHTRCAGRISTYKHKQGVNNSTAHNNAKTFTVFLKFTLQNETSDSTSRCYYRERQSVYSEDVVKNRPFHTVERDRATRDAIALRLYTYIS